MVHERDRRIERWDQPYKCQAAQPRAEAKHIELRMEVAPDLPAVAVDPERLGHALNNLLDNALTYTPQRGRITLGAGVSPDGVTLSVTDTGCGIPGEYLPHVFEKFFRVPGQSRGGTGLGLAIVNEIVTAHGGSITCESQPGVGTTFRLTLPVVGAGNPTGDGLFQRDGVQESTTIR